MNGKQKWEIEEKKYQRKLRAAKKNKKIKVKKPKKKLNYSTYIKSKKWKRKSKKFQQQRNFQCEICGKKSEVTHHLHYKTIGKESLKDIQVLCRDCHANLHEKQGATDSITKRYLNLNL